MKYVRKWLLAVLAVMLLVCGCSGQRENPEEGEGETLWVVTERSNSDGMNYQAEMIAQRMEEKYEDLTIELEILPTGEERENRLKQLHTQIMAGGGPDVYLLPTGSVLTVDLPAKNTKIKVDPLFPDVQQTMHTGLFQDIASYYDADEDLGTGALKTEIMDAGCIGEQRYVLPMRYDMDLLMTDAENWTASGLDPALTGAGIDVLTEAVLTQDATGLGAYALQLPDDLGILPETFDYEKGELLLTAQEIADYMRLYQRWNAVHTPLVQSINETEAEKIIQANPDMVGTYEFYGYPTVSISSFNSVTSYISDKFHWGLYGFPLYTETMENLLDSALMGKRLGRDMRVYPLRSTDGQASATVTYYGAVGGGCAVPELAYEFLRQFLTEEFQWDIYRPRVKKTNEIFDHEPPEPQRYILVESSWPVRFDGSVEPLWDNRAYQLFHYGYSFNARILGIQTPAPLVEGDITVLDVPIDKVHFPIAQEAEETLAYALFLLNDENGAPTDADIDALAEEVWQNLWWHLAEG